MYFAWSNFQNFRNFTIQTGILKPSIGLPLGAYKVVILLICEDYKVTLTRGSWWGIMELRIVDKKYK